MEPLLTEVAVETLGVLLGVGMLHAITRSGGGINHDASLHSRLDACAYWIVKFSNSGDVGSSNLVSVDVGSSNLIVGCWIIKFSNSGDLHVEVRDEDLLPASAED